MRRGGGRGEVDMMGEARATGRKEVGRVIESHVNDGLDRRRTIVSEVTGHY